MCVYVFAYMHVSDLYVFLCKQIRAMKFSYIWYGNKKIRVSIHKNG